mmetsp:Transcript_8075/g.18900  ORF Transcript_8075/g.18900 Transcript_8075/m.18900 type:complete len:202 (-) Transcript_8075:236-841(-)
MPAIAPAQQVEDQDMPSLWMSSNSNVDVSRVVAQAYEDASMTARQHQPSNEIVPSLGSMQHEAGTCTPCVFANSPTVGCRKGPFCSFCHYRHRISSEKRLPKAKREQLRKFIQHLTAAVEKDPEYLEKNKVQIPASLEKNPALLRSIVNRMEELAATSKTFQMRGNGLENKVQHSVPPGLSPYAGINTCWFEDERPICLSL